MPIRNPFTRRPGAVVPADDGVYADKEHNYPGFERVDIVGSKASSVLSIRSARSQDTGEYKMSGKWPQSLSLATFPSGPCSGRASHDSRWAGTDMRFARLVVNDSGVYLPVSCASLALGCICCADC